MITDVVFSQPKRMIFVSPNTTQARQYKYFYENIHILPVSHQGRRKVLNIGVLMNFHAAHSFNPELLRVLNAYI